MRLGELTRCRMTILTAKVRWTRTGRKGELVQSSTEERVELEDVPGLNWGYANGE